MRGPATFGSHTPRGSAPQTLSTPHFPHPRSEVETEEEFFEPLVDAVVTKPRERGRRSSIALTRELNKLNEVELSGYKDIVMGGDDELSLDAVSFAAEPPADGAAAAPIRLRKPRERGRRSSLVLTQQLEKEMGQDVEDVSLMEDMSMMMEMPLAVDEQ